MSRVTRIISWCSCIVALVGASRFGAPVTAAQDPVPVFRTGADVVSIEASVRRDRRPVTGLKVTDFEILDNGTPQDIADLSYERLPIDVTVVLDLSASVNGVVLDDLRRALRQLRTDLGQSDRLRLVTFNQRARRLVDFAEPSTAIDSALSSLGASGSSAVFDSLAVALTAGVPRGRRQLVVLFSDGQDSSSINDAGVLLDVAKRTTPTVAVVLSSASRQRPASMVRSTSGTAKLTIGELFDQVARETGGVVISIDAGENIGSAFRRALEEFRSTYVLYFTPKGVERGGAHTLDVRVKRQGTDVRARRGYVVR